MALPFVAVLLLAVVQVGLVVRAQVLVVHAAREGARAAAVDPADDAALAAARDGSGLDADRLRVTARGRDGPGSRVTVAVSYRLATDVPLVGALIGDLDLAADATMRVE